MFKNKLTVAAIVVAFFLIAVPAPSQAASWKLTLFSEPAAGLFARIERWWNLIVPGTERAARPEPSPVWRKNGCGIDPNGQWVCDRGPGTSQAMEPVDPGVN